MASTDRAPMALAGEAHRHVDPETLLLAPLDTQPETGAEAETGDPHDGLRAPRPLAAGEALAAEAVRLAEAPSVMHWQG